MWPSTFNKKSATISGWQALGDFAAVKDQLRKIRASTRISNKKSGAAEFGSGGGSGVGRPLPPLPGHPHHHHGHQQGQGNKSVRFSLPGGPGGGHLHPLSDGSSGSDQGYESDQSRVRHTTALASQYSAHGGCFQERRRQLELPGLLSKLTSFKTRPAEDQYGASSCSTLTRHGASTLTRPGKHGAEHGFYGAGKNLGESDRDMSTSSPVLLEMYDHVKVGEKLNQNI